jgi:anti-sigma factor RsiW
MRSRRMRHIAKLLVFVCLLVFAPVAAVPFQQPALQRQTDKRSETVYVTRTGKRYHQEGCRYLASSQIPMSLKDAQAKGYTPCKVCHPPR